MIVKTIGNNGILDNGDGTYSNVRMIKGRRYRVVLNTTGEKPTLASI